MTWTPIAFEPISASRGELCQYKRQPTDNPCGAKAQERHAATWQKVSRKVVDGKVVDERVQFLCVCAMCCERIKLNLHREVSARSEPVPPRTGSPAPATPG